MHSSSFAGPAVRRRYVPSFAVRARPGPAPSRAMVGPNNRELHSEMLLAYGRAFDDDRFDTATGCTYLDIYRLLLGRARELGVGVPPLLVTGNVVPDLRLDETPSVRLIGEFDGPVTTFAVVEETSLAAILAVHSATVTARSRGYDAFVVLLADRSELAYKSELDTEPAQDLGLLLRFELAEGGVQDGAASGGAPDRLQWRCGLTGPQELVDAAAELAATATGPVVVPAALAERWHERPEGTLVAPVDRPVTGLVDLALGLTTGSEPLLIGFDPGRGQLAALSLRVPAVDR